MHSLPGQFLNLERVDTMTTTIYETATEAIIHSALYGEVGHCEDTRENHECLLAACDDHCSGNGLEDYWTDDPDSDHKMLWRVNVATDC